MGKRQRNKNRGPTYKRRRKQENYWIQNCIELQPPPDVKPALTITISRVELNDEHSHGAKSSGVTGEVSQEKQVDQKDTAGESKEEEEGPESESAPIAAAAAGETAPLAAAAPLPIDIEEAFIAVHRNPSAQAPTKPFAHQNYKPLPNGDCGDGVKNPHPKVHDKYWAQRKRFFSRFDDGIQLDPAGWYSVTPEAIANHIASRLTGEVVVLDPFCGCGGNAIAFSGKAKLVVAMDVDRTKLELAANNAAVYKIPYEKLILVHGNACDALSRYKKGQWQCGKYDGNEESSVETTTVNGYTIGGLELLPKRIDSIFLSPPWGGPDYEAVGKRQYHVETCIQVKNTAGSEMNGQELLQASAAAAEQVVYFLPRNVNGVSLGRSALHAGYRTMEMEQNNLNNKFKTVTCYFGV